MAETANPGTNLYRLNQWTNTESAPSEYGDPAASTTFVVETSYTCSFPLALLTAYRVLPLQAIEMIAPDPPMTPVNVVMEPAPLK